MSISYDWRIDHQLFAPRSHTILHIHASEGRAWQKKEVVMLRFIKLWILRYQLAPIFKQAEALAERGATSGSEEYIKLLTRARELVKAYIQEFPNFDYYAEFPAMNDLYKMTIQPEPAKPKAGLIALIVAAIFSSAMGLGAYGAVIHWTYCLLTHAH
jgi:hypothetical protein